MAAVLTCGPNAVLSHRSAAALWGIAPPPTSGIDVLADSDRHARPGLRVRRATLSAVDRNSCDDVPTTSLPRTLLDIAAVAPWALERALEESERLELFDLRAFEELISRSRGRRGVRRLRDALAAYREPAFTRSELERRFLRLVEEAGLPKPSVNIWVAGHRSTCSGRRNGSASSWTVTSFIARGSRTSKTAAATKSWPLPASR